MSAHVLVLKMFPHQAVKARGAAEGVNIPFNEMTSRMVLSEVVHNGITVCGMSSRMGCDGNGTCGATTMAWCCLDVRGKVFCCAAVRRPLASAIPLHPWHTVGPSASRTGQPEPVIDCEMKSPSAWLHRQ